MPLFTQKFTSAYAELSDKDLNPNNADLITHHFCSFNPDETKRIDEAFFAAIISDAKPLIGLQKLISKDCWSIIFRSSLQFTEETEIQ